MSNINQCLVKYIRSSLIIVGIIGLVACAAEQSNEKNTDKASQKATSIYDKNRIIKPASLVTSSDEMFISDDHFVITPKQTLPPVFNQRLVYSSGVNETLAQTFANISKLSHVPIVFADDVNTKAASKETNTAGVTPYQGSLQQVIGQLANRYGLFWNYKDGKVNIFLLETKIYALDAPIGSFTADNNISSTSDTTGASTSGSSSTAQSAVGGNSDMSLKYTVKADSPWTAAMTTLKDMLSPAGKIQGNPVEGYIAITDNPDVQEKVADYIEKINKKTNQKIAVRVDVYDVQASSTTDLGLDLNAVANILSNDSAEIITQPGGLLNQDLAGNMSSLTVSGGGGTLHKQILSALNTLGKTTLVTGATVYTVSGQPAPIQSVEERTYLASSSTTLTQDSSQTSLTPGTVVTGYSMMVTPKLEANNQVMLTLNLQLSTLINMEPITSGSGTSASTIQLPTIDSKNFLENMVLHSGQSLLIAGFQDDKGSTDISSPTSTDYWLFGGGKSTKKVKTTTVIVVTPYIIGD
ncbi:MAG: hypothetical protein V4496_04445 [Pseudomonadota bacterium]